MRSYMVCRSQNPWTNTGKEKPHTMLLKVFLILKGKVGLYLQISHYFNSLLFVEQTGSCECRKHFGKTLVIVHRRQKYIDGLDAIHSGNMIIITQLYQSWIVRLQQVKHENNKRETMLMTNVLKQVFFKENVRYLVWICRDPISSIFRDPMTISLILGTRFEILGTRIRSLKRLKKTWLMYRNWVFIVKNSDIKTVSKRFSSSTHDKVKCKLKTRLNCIIIWCHSLRVEAYNEKE